MDAAPRRKWARDRVAIRIDEICLNNCRLDWKIFKKVGDVADLRLRERLDERRRGRNRFRIITDECNSPDRKTYRNWRKFQDLAGTGKLPRRVRVNRTLIDD